MASFDGGKNDYHRSDKTNISDSALREILDSVLKSLNAPEGENSTTFFGSSYIAQVRSLLEECSPSVKTLSTVEKSPILNIIADSTVNKEVSEKMQIQLQPQWTHTGRENEGEINMEVSFYTDHVPSTLYQDLGAFNVPSNYATSSTSIGTTTVLQQSPAEETYSSYFTCTVCFTIKRSKKSLKCHLALDHGIGKYTCDVCERVFAYENELNLHISAYQLRNFSECSMCKKKFHHSEHLEVHKNLYHLTSNEGEMNMEDTVYMD